VTTVRTTCPRDCYDSCGVLVIQRNGRTVVRGDPDDPVSRGALCRKCSIGYNGAFLDPAARLSTPMVRTGAKGEGRFRGLGWDEALALIAERVGGAVEAAGGASVLNAHYTGTFSTLAYGFPMRFFNRLGATEVDPDTVCNKAGHVALDYVYGTSLVGFDPRTAADAAAIMVWGANPSASAPHAHEHWLAEAPGAVIVVDPIRTATAEQADLHLQPFPGSDAALAFAIMHVIEHDGLANREFLSTHTVGSGELLEMLAPCTPQWGEQVTGVPAAQIERAARLYAGGPALLWIGQGLQRQPTGGNVVRAVSLLPALTGNLGRRGGGFLYLNDQAPIDGDWLTGAGLGTPPRPVSHMDLAGRLEDRERSRALFCWNINIAASNPEQARLRAALAREDLFTVVAELFPTDTTDYADVVLPAASFLEFDDVVTPYFNLEVSAQVAAVDPPGEALPNQEIFRRLARAMGYTEPELFEPDDVLLDEIVRQAGVAESFEQLAEARSIPLSPGPLVQFRDRRFPTSSGRVEIASAAAEADGHPRVPQPWADARPGGGRLRLLSPASAWTLNDTFANDRKVAHAMGEATVTLHPDDAARLEVGDGDRVTAANRHGTLTGLVVCVSDAVPPGVALSPKGRWPRREPSRANVNVLNPGSKADLGESTAVHGVEVAITPDGAPAATR
jgi:anaerobic selenocysteine-containing dehydrogenase